jgi:hypothetical protein
MGTFAQAELGMAFNLDSPSNQKANLSCGTLTTCGGPRADRQDSKATGKCLPDWSRAPTACCQLRVRGPAAPPRLVGDQAYASESTMSTTLAYAPLMSGCAETWARAPHGPDVSPFAVADYATDRAIIYARIVEGNGLCCFRYEKTSPAAFSPHITPANSVSPSGTPRASLSIRAFRN